MCSRTAVLLFSLLATACGNRTAVGGGTWRSLAADALTAHAAQATKADAARAALAARLLGALGRALQEGGAAAAIDVCHTRAPALAAEVAAEFGVRIGRTASRLRNAANAAPTWAAATLAATPASPLHFAGPAGELGTLHPIVLQPLCVQCHGKPDQLATGVADALRSRYPDDRATGFAPGDVRGWFWVEVAAGS